MNKTKKLNDRLRSFSVVHHKLLMGFAVAALLALSVTAPLGSNKVYAQQQQLGNCASNGSGGCSCTGDMVPSVDGTGCVEATQTDCAGDGKGGPVVLTTKNCQIVAYLVIAINAMTAIAGVAIIGGMVYGGYLYLTARDNPGQVQAGRQKIVWALIALLILIFGYAGLQWLVPGGILHEQATPIGNNALPN